MHLLVGSMSTQGNDNVNFVVRGQSDAQRTRKAEQEKQWFLNDTLINLMITESSTTVQRQYVALVHAVF